MADKSTLGLLAFLRRDGAGADLDPEVIAEAVADYLDEHGATVTETDPTVPGWAKAVSKPSYTAAEVGAIAAPANPSSGQILVYDGTAWVALSISAWTGGSY